MVFGGALIIFILASFIGMASVTPSVTNWSECIQSAIRDTDTITDCDGKTNYFPLYGSNFGMENMLFFIIILYFKQPEDYIANYSQAHNHKIVSIYQRRIVDDVGNIDGGLSAEIKEIIKRNKSAQKPSATP